MERAAQTILDNAESIVGSEKNGIGFDVTIHNTIMFPNELRKILNSRSNNYRKMHGKPMRRRKHIMSTRWKLYRRYFKKIF